jgi:monoamine oxidase
MSLNRRDFLLLAGGLTLSRPGILSARNTRNIIVAGAGLSGLSAALELAKLGYQVTVIEARSRIGGRVFTLKEPFRDNQYVELGGELVGNGYKRLLGYADDFGIPYEVFEEEFETGGALTNLQDGVGTTVFMKGVLYPIGSVLNPHPYGLEGGEAKVLPPTLLSRYLRLLTREVSEKPELLVDFDKFSLAELLRARGVSDTVIKLINISGNFNSIETVSAGGVLFEAQRRSSAGKSANRIRGGNFEIPRALALNAKRLGVRFILNAKIAKIKHYASSVQVAFIDKLGRVQNLVADRLVCTIPFSVLRGIRFSPPLPEAKMRAINELTYIRVTKTYMQGRRFEWDRHNIGSSIWTDTPLERIFSMSGIRGDRRGIFGAWTEGEGAELPESMSDIKRRSWTKKEFEKILPFMKGEIERTFTKSWTRDQFAKGAGAHFLKGQFADLRQHIKTPVGAIHFAGEHTAEFAPGMEGALESAERVVKEIAG